MSPVPNPATIPLATLNTLGQNVSRRSSRFTLVPLDGPAKLSPRPFLVEDIIHEGSTFLIFGASQAGKSFLAIDLVLSVAAGIPWMGHKVKQGPAIYVASEGRDSVSIRVAGWKGQHAQTKALPAFGLTDGDVSLLDDGHVDDLISEIKTLGENGKPKLVVIDTLSSAIPGADENTQATMSAVMRYLRRIATETGATVGVVHHVSKASPREPRGNNALFAGVDTSLFVGGSSSRRTMEVVKQRDGATGKKVAFDLAKQTITCEDGTFVTTCVPHLLPGTAAGNEKQASRPDTATELLRLANDLASDTSNYRAATQGSEIEVALNTLKNRAYADLYAEAPSEDAKRKRFERDLARLKADGKLQVDKNNVKIVGAQDMIASPISNPSPARASFAGQDTPL